MKTSITILRYKYIPVIMLLMLTLSCKGGKEEERETGGERNLPQRERAGGLATGKEYDVDRDISPAPRNTYQYVSRNRRDPFESVLESPQYSDRTGLSLLLDTIQLKGVISRGNTRIALVSDAKGKGFVLKQGESLIDGKVLKIEDDSITFLVYGYGASVTMTLKLESREEG
jgi:hypothetical protein